MCDNVLIPYYITMSTLAIFFPVFSKLTIHSPKIMQILLMYTSLLFYLVSWSYLSQDSELASLAIRCHLASLCCYKWSVERNSVMLKNFAFIQIWYERLLQQMDIYMALFKWLSIWTNFLESLFFYIYISPKLQILKPKLQFLLSNMEVGGCFLVGLLRNSHLLCTLNHHWIWSYSKHLQSKI